MIKNITIAEMVTNVYLATDNLDDVNYFIDKVKHYTDSDYEEKMKRIFIENAYETLMVRMALETIPNQEERAVFYIENGIVYETAKTIEEAILPLLEKYKREGK